MEAIILAGGKGTRLSSVVNDRPKPLAEINGKPFLDLLMNQLISNGVTHFILSTGYRSEMIESYFGTQFNTIPISYAKETVPLGTGGAVLLARQNLVQDKPFLLMNGDTLFDCDIPSLRKIHSATSADISLGLFHADQKERYGFVAMEKFNRITEIGNRKANLAEPAIGGTFILSPNALDGIRQVNAPISLEEDVLKVILNNGGLLSGLLSNTIPVDIGTPEDYLKLKQLYE